MRLPLCEIADFARLDLRVCQILTATPLPRARKPAYVLELDCGADWGVRKTSAQITDRYAPESLIGKKVIALVNLPPKQIANHQSQCLVLGGLDAENGVSLICTDHELPVGARIA